MSDPQCAICLSAVKEVVPCLTFPSCSSRTHNPVCCECYENYIDDRIHVACGQMSCVICKNKIEENDLVNWLSGWNSNLRNKRDQETLSQLTRQEGGFVNCYECGSIYSVDTVVSTFIVCTNHNKPRKTCIRHRAKMHEGETCDEYDYRIENNEMNTLNNLMSEVFIATIVKGKCPGCSHGWQKENEDQCDHITCVCGMEFCGVCGVDYTECRRDNSAHGKTCKYHSDNLPAFPKEYL